MSTGRTAAFLIHGLGGTQFDLGSMHKTLKRAGIDTHSLTLPGHGTTPEDLAGVRAEAWLAAVTAKYREVVMQYDTVHVIGMCMGSLLALALCAQEGHARGRLVTLAPPIYIDGWATPWYRAFRHLMYWLPFVPNRMRVDEDEPFGIKNALVRSIVKAKFERGDNFHYRWVPLACIREVDRLRRIAKRGARALRCDTLVMHAREDELTSLQIGVLPARSRRARGNRRAGEQLSPDLRRQRPATRRDEHPALPGPRSGRGRQAGGRGGARRPDGRR